MRCSTSLSLALRAWSTDYNPYRQPCGNYTGSSLTEIKDNILRCLSAHRGRHVKRIKIFASFLRNKIVWQKLRCRLLGFNPPRDVFPVYFAPWVNNISTLFVLVAASVHDDVNFYRWRSQSFSINVLPTSSQDAEPQWHGTPINSKKHKH